MPAWAQTATEEPATGQTSATDMQATDQPVTAAPAQEVILPEQAETQIRAEDLMGARVVGSDGEEIGQVEYLIFGIGKKKVGLKRDQAELQDDPDTGEKTVVVSLAKTDLETAPDFVTKEEREAEERAAAQQLELEQQQLQQLAPPAGDAATQ